MANTVRINVDGREYEVPAGTNLVDATKQLGIDIPVFCYHPKLDPVGMCRMCLVELGGVQKDRATGQVMLDDKGNPKIAFQPKLQTACTTNVSDGLYVRTTTQPVLDARKNVVEFLLTSHPLDCPICDKGGECPLQNLTMEHGPGTTRMNFEDKMRLDKHVPLGDLIFLDEERCIQCARCIRFQDEIVGDDVLAFHERGRSLQIITDSDPGFDSYFSGNTTDICPVGALTTEDFRFGARPWELTSVPSICPHCPVGCNISLSTRLDRDSGGKTVIKRVMPRQNEQVNEIWICDKGRFGHHYTRSEDRLMEPMMRNASGNRIAVGWNDALKSAAEAIKAADNNVAAIAGPGMSNEDLYMLRELLSSAGSDRLGAWPPVYSGADMVAQVGVGKGTNLGLLSKGDAVLVIASDLEEEAPVWRLRVKQAHDRGAYLVVANARSSRMDDFADATVRYDYTHVGNLKQDNPDVLKKLAEATNLVIVAGTDGLTDEGSRALMRILANFLIETGHVGKPQNGLIVTLPGANAMGQYYLGFTSDKTQDIIKNPPKVLIVAQADILADDPQAAAWLDKVDTIISLNLFADDVAARAYVAMPIQSFAERDGSFVNGERRVQRFYTAQGPMGEAIPAWQALNRIGERASKMKSKVSAAAVMLDITQNVAEFAGCRYADLSKVEAQFPDVGGADLYYGGTAYKNNGGLGVQIPSAADQGKKLKAAADPALEGAKVGRGKLLVVPTTRLYNRERTFIPSEKAVLGSRVAQPYVDINAADAKKLNINDGDMVEVATGQGAALKVQAHVNGKAPKGTVLLPRHLTAEAAPLAPVAGEVSKAQE